MPLLQRVFPPPGLAYAEKAPQGIPEGGPAYMEEDCSKVSSVS